MADIQEPVIFKESKKMFVRSASILVAFVVLDLLTHLFLNSTFLWILTGIFIAGVAIAIILLYMTQNLPYVALYPDGLAYRPMYFSMKKVLWIDIEKITFSKVGIYDSIILKFKDPSKSPSQMLSTPGELELAVPLLPISMDEFYTLLKKYPITVVR